MTDSALNRDNVNFIQVDGCKFLTQINTLSFNCAGILKNKNNQ